MTTTSSTVPLPSQRTTTPEQEENDDSSTMVFYISNIELYGILNKILSEVYDAWCDPPTQRAGSDGQTRQGSLDVIIRLEEQLSSYEANLPPSLNWCSRAINTNDENYSKDTVRRQRNVLHARYVIPPVSSGQVRFI